MTTNKINIAIAKACGWKYHVQKESPFGGLPVCDKWWTDLSGAICTPPSYTTDLNAMHEAEKMLSADNIERYSCKLSFLIETYSDEHHSSTLFPVIHATAAQRAEAFLRTIDKWKPTKL